jgi:hypothetical protein
MAQTTLGTRIGTIHCSRARAYLSLADGESSPRSSAETVVAARSGVGAIDADGRDDAPVRLALSA